jgi:AcrR family transcriptional regulator
MMNKREKQKEETVADILRVAEELFHEQGYEKTTIHNIAERCGLSKGDLYHHFKSKEEVLKRICYRHYIYLKETFLPIVEDTEPSMLEKLRRIMTIARNSQMNTAFATFSKGKSPKSSGIENAALGKLLDNYSEKVYIDVFAPLLDEGRKKGECAFPGSAEVMAVFIHHLDTGMSEQLNRILSDEDRTSSEKRIRDVIEGFTFALSRLLNIDENTVAHITLADKMLEQYLKILKN